MCTFIGCSAGARPNRTRHGWLSGFELVAGCQAGAGQQVEACLDQREAEVAAQAWPSAGVTSRPRLPMTGSGVSPGGLAPQFADVLIG